MNFLEQQGIIVFTLKDIIGLFVFGVLLLLFVVVVARSFIINMKERYKRRRR